MVPTSIECRGCFFQKVTIGRSSAINLTAGERFHGLDLCFFHPRKFGVLMDPDCGQLLLHLSAILADDTFVGVIFVTGQHSAMPCSCSSPRAPPRSGCCRTCSLGFSHASHGCDHGLADAGPVERCVLAVEIVRRHAVQTRNAVPVGLGLGEHVGNRIEAMLQRQRFDGIANVLIGEIEAETVGQQPAQPESAVVRYFAEYGLHDVPRGVIRVAEQHHVVERIVAAFHAHRHDRKSGVMHRWNGRPIYASLAPVW